LPEVDHVVGRCPEAIVAELRVFGAAIDLASHSLPDSVVGVVSVYAFLNARAWWSPGL
jgi:hypothetical protein